MCWALLFQGRRCDASEDAEPLLSWSSAGAPLPWSLHGQTWKAGQ